MSIAARVTVIVPAWNAERTIEETVASVLAQTCPDWQLLVVDDGSTDATRSIVTRLAQSDARIRVLDGPGRGPAAARNRAIELAATPFVSFLDADDLLMPQFLERMLGPLEAGASVTATYTGWVRLSPDGTSEPGPTPEVDGDLFDRFASTCVFPLHACVVRREALLEVGAFDARIREDGSRDGAVHEDWDLWQRLARTGAWFTRVPGALVVYRMRAGSRSRDSQRVLRDGLAVIARGHARDPRVARPHPSHADGADPARAARHAFNHLAWSAGMALAAGDDPVALLDAVSGLTAPDLERWEIGGTLLEALRVTLSRPSSASLSLVADRAEAVLGFLAALEAASGAAGIAAEAAGAMDRLIAQQDTTPRPRTLLVTHEAAVELAAPLSDVTGLPARVQRLHAVCTYAGEPVAEVDIPVTNGHVTASVMADAVAAAACWPLLERFLRHCVHTVTGRSATRFDDESWREFVQELFDRRGATLGEVFDATPAGSIAEPVELQSVDVSDDLPDRLVPGESAALDATVGGAPFGVLVVPAPGRVLTGGAVRRAFAESKPETLVRLVVREGVIGWPANVATGLRARLAYRRSIAN